MNTELAQALYTINKLAKKFVGKKGDYADETFFESKADFKLINKLGITRDDLYEAKDAILTHLLEEGEANCSTFHEFDGGFKAALVEYGCFTFHTKYDHRFSNLENAGQLHDINSKITGKKMSAEQAFKIIGSYMLFNVDIEENVILDTVI